MKREALEHWLNYRYEDLLNQYGEGEREFVVSAILNWWNQNDPTEENYEYADNARLAISANEESMELYEEKKSGGCCGFLDVEFGPSPSGYT